MTMYFLTELIYFPSIFASGWLNETAKTLMSTVFGRSTLFLLSSARGRLPFLALCVDPEDHLNNKP
jgi:hypothetical protein